jgi:hypothetical protein
MDLSTAATTSGNLPKSDSTTSLSSLISIGNESKNSDSLPICIICQGNEGPILVTINENSCVCLYHYHGPCLKTWYNKHSSQCPLCRKQNLMYQRPIIPYTVDCSIWQKSLLAVCFISTIFLLIWSIVKK